MIAPTWAKPISATLRQKFDRLRISVAFGFSGDPDFANARPLQSIHQGHQFLHWQFAIGPDYHCDVGIRFAQIDQAVSQFVVINSFVIESYRLRAIDRKNLHPVRIDRGIVRPTGRNHQISAVFEQRRGDHENDQQNEGEIEQRSDIDLAK
jgi:hypothetical protein